MVHAPAAHAPAAHAPAVHAPAHAPRVEPVATGEPHTAPHDEIVAVVQDLIRTRGSATLDSLANALKSRGFSRPPGSPRLITRLRRIKELDVNRAGVITLVGGAPAAAAVAHDKESEPEAAAVAPAEAVAPEEQPVRAAVEPAEDELEEAEVPDALNREGAHLQTASGIGDGGRHRRSRRGGRRRRGRGGEGREGGGRGGWGGGGGGGRPPREPAPPRPASGTDRARDLASRFAPRDVAPSWISGQPLA
jgi:hypothetical protein